MIYDNAFWACRGLKIVTFQEGSRLQKISFSCFEDSGLEEFVAPSGLREIEGGAFYGCKSLKQVVLNEGLEALADNASSGVFQNCKI